MNTETTYPEQKEGKPNPQQGRKVQWDLRSTSAPRAIRHSIPEEVQVVRLTEKSKTPNRGSERAAGHDLFSTETTTVPAKEQRMIGTGIAIALPPGTYARIAPRSGLAFKHGIITNAGASGKKPNYDQDLQWLGSSPTPWTKPPRYCGAPALN